MFPVKCGLMCSSEIDGKLEAFVCFRTMNGFIQLGCIARALRCGCEIMPHPQCSAVLALSDFFLFTDMESPLCGFNFSVDQDFIIELETWFCAQAEAIYN